MNFWRNFVTCLLRFYVTVYCKKYLKNLKPLKNYVIKTIDQNKLFPET